MTPVLEPVLVWGATGFIGQHLVQTFVERRIPVLALTRRSVIPELSTHQPLVRWISIPKGDADIDAFADAIRQVEVVFNLVGNSGAVASNLNPSASLDA